MNTISEQYAEALQKKFQRERDLQVLQGIPYVLDAPSFAVEKGQKFDRITQTQGSGAHVHAFVEKATGKLIKAASWKAPAKDKNGPAYRYDLSTDEGRLEAIFNADKHGSYLYADYPVQVPSPEAYAAAGIEYPWEV